MRLTIKKFVQIVVDTFPITEPIYEFGSLRVEGQEELADIRPLFPNKHFVGCDMRKGSGVDKILNLHHIDVPSNTVGTVFCLDTLEHVEYPHKALEEIYRITKPNGMAVISSVMNYPIHNHPFDYWRFTPEAFRSLLKPFSGSFVGYATDEVFPHTVVGIGFKGEKPSLKHFESLYENWQAEILAAEIPRYKFLKLFIPPIFIQLKGKIRK